MTCEECIHLGTKCEACIETHLLDIQRSASAGTKWRKAFTHKAHRLPKCSCCTKVDIAIFYRNCPEDAYVGHKRQANKGGQHCVKNFKYFAKRI